MKTPTRDMAMVEVTRALEAAFPDQPERVQGLLDALGVEEANEVLRLETDRREKADVRFERERARAVLLDTRIANDAHAVFQARRLSRVVEADPKFAREVADRARELDREAARAGKPRANVKERKRQSFRNGG